MGDVAGQRFSQHGPGHVVLVVDDDPRICEALSELLATFDLPVVTFGSAAAYMAPKPNVPTCLILDMQLPDMNGLDLQSRDDEGGAAQIVFLTGRGDVPSSVRAMKAGSTSKSAGNSASVKSR
jgi:FixJ family two-component response regulator